MSKVVNIMGADVLAMQLYTKLINIYHIPVEATLWGQNKLAILFTIILIDLIKIWIFCLN